jgi:hypothetical protein
LAERAKGYNIGKAAKEKENEAVKEKEILERFSKGNLSEFLFTKGQGCAFKTTVRGQGRDFGVEGKRYSGIIVFFGTRGEKEKKFYLNLEDFSGDLKEIKRLEDLKGKKFEQWQAPPILKKIINKKLAEERKMELEEARKTLPKKATVNSLSDLRREGSGVCVFATYYGRI